MLPRVYRLLKEMRPIDNAMPLRLRHEAGKPYSETSPYYYEALQTAVRRANKAREKAGLAPMEHVEWHDLRRTCGCRLLQDRGSRWRRSAAGSGTPASR